MKFLRSVLLVTTAFSIARPVLAQTMTGVPSSDSAAVARAAWGRVNRAAAANDVMQAYMEAKHAASAWPWQPAYLWGRTVLGLSAGDTSAVRVSLEAFAALGLGRDLRKDARFNALASAPWFDALAARLADNIASIANSRTVATIHDETFWPEGIDFDPRTKTFYVTSLAHGTVGAIDSTGSMRDVWQRNRLDVGRVFAVRVDAGHNVVYATMAKTATAPAALLRVGIATGAIEKRWTLPAGSVDHAPGDLILLPDGTVVISDSQNPALYVLAPGADTLRAIRSAYFNSPQGMVLARDGSYLILADYSTGLLRLDLKTEQVSRITDVATATVLGLDGLAWSGDAIIAIQNGVTPPRVVQITFDADYRRVVALTTIDRNTAVADEPTNGVMVGGEFVYIANSQWDKRDDNGQVLPNVILKNPILLGLTIRR